MPQSKRTLTSAERVVRAAKQTTEPFTAKDLSDIIGGAREISSAKIGAVLSDMGWPVIDTRRGVALYEAGTKAREAMQ